MAFAIAQSGLSGLAPRWFIEPGSFALGMSFNLLLMVIVGGSGYFFGPSARSSRCCCRNGRGSRVLSHPSMPRWSWR
jgi:hypothetical protein